MASSFASTGSMILHQALELNEDGIFELSCGRPGPTVSAYFEEAADLLMESLNRSSSSSSSATNSCSSLASTSTSRVQIPHLQDDLFYIYPCAMSYDVASSARSSRTASAPDQCPSHVEMIFALAVIRFNLALCYHQQAKLISKRSYGGANKRREEEDCLHRALRYYKECHQVLQSLPNNNIDDDGNNNEDLLLMTLAVMNNQAQILYELRTDGRQYLEKSRLPSSAAASVEAPPHNNTTTTADDDTAVFQKLLTYSMNTVLSADIIDNMSMVEKSQIHEFIQNAIIFQLQRPCVAPCA